MKNNKIQVGLFYEWLNEKPDKLFYGLNEHLGGLFDDTPVILPTFNDAPPEIPLLQATTKNRYYSLTISRMRIDFILNNHDLNDGANDRADKFYTLLTQYMEYIVNKMKVNRVGLISTTIYECTSPVEKIKTKYFKKMGDNPSELSFRKNVREQKFGFIINNITDIQSTVYRHNDVNKEGIIINKDINNVPTVENTFNKRSIIEFFDFYYKYLLIVQVKELI